MNILTTYDSINQEEWGALLTNSLTANWFQSPDAYNFFAMQPELFKPFVVAVKEEKLLGICVGYVTQENAKIRHFFTRRAIIIGGPVLAPTATSESVLKLMVSVRELLEGQTIYIETRNFNDYTPWQSAFLQAGFSYEQHLNFHVNTSSLDLVNHQLDENRRRNIRASIRNGATILNNPTNAQVADFYCILQKIYSTRVKTPLFPLSFFLRLNEHPNGRLILVQHHDRIIGGIAAVELPNHCLYEWFVAGEDGMHEHIYPSSLATYAGLKYAAENGIPRFDMMGAGTPQSDYGVRDFKARFGGEKVEHGRFKYIANPVLYKIGEIAVKILKHK